MKECKGNVILSGTNTYTGATNSEDCEVNVTGALDATA